MPVEIKELTIRVQVNETRDSQSNTGSAGSGGDPKDLVKEAVEEVMRIIDSKKER